jgi:hypothetical protein
MYLITNAIVGKKKSKMLKWTGEQDEEKNNGLRRLG